MEKAITKEELLNFKNKLILEYDYYLDLSDRIKKVERFETIDDYIKAIKNIMK